MATSGSSDFWRRAAVVKKPDSWSAKIARYFCPAWLADSISCKSQPIICMGRRDRVLARGTSDCRRFASTQIVQGETVLEGEFDGRSRSMSFTALFWCILMISDFAGCPYRACARSRLMSALSGGFGSGGAFAAPLRQNPALTRDQESTDLPVRCPMR